MKRVSPLLVAACLLASAGVSAAGSPTLSEWLNEQHQIMQRYRTVLRQAVHDLSYDYAMPPLMLPIALDFYTGYVAHVHELERQVLYPAVRSLMTPEQQRQLEFVDQEIDSEHRIVRDWQAAAGQTERIEAIDYLERMLNRHVVLQERWVLPLLEQLSAQQPALLQALATREAALFGRDGRRRQETLLTYLEGEIARISPRM